jgi:hypothetical protein
MDDIVEIANYRITSGQESDIYGDVELMGRLVAVIAKLQKQRQELVDALRQTRDTYGGAFVPAFVSLECE